MKIVLKRSHANEWWGNGNCWTSDEAQAMVFPKVSEAVDCGLMLGNKDLRVVVIGFPVAPHLLNAWQAGSDERIMERSLQAC